MIFSILEHILTHISFSVVSIVLTIYFLTLLVNLDEIIGFFDSSDKGIIITFFGITGLLLTRWIYSGHFPLSNLYESLIFLSWAFSIIHMVSYFNKKQQNKLNTITAPSVIFIQGFATSGLLNKMPQSAILVPALQSQWLMMHVSMMILGYGALLCGSLLSIALLVITFRKVGPTFWKKNIKKNFLLNELFSFDVLYYINERNSILLQQNINFSFSRNYYRYQLIQQLDFWSFRIISLGFIFLTVGILSGAVWANETWGSYWNWDPKETWAFITWTIFAIYLHIKTNRNVRGINSAIVALIGFILIWICYFGVNLLGIGLHSYGSFTSN
ncbi:Cytochrome c-type biogenesis protein CcsA [Arabidopsis suecica]|jgi:cytochrome c-type biogenesis protein CcsB|uniref:Cytochrome c biogenesis protein CcsA n=3 Tax=Arabidopsis TaxID=3701 RepID=CCSA_ARATH|nr:cytochrome c biogenesis protein [Arabidopsis thaliana]YP_009258217.1 ycf5 [Arabidopsis suecica]YP_010704106.1 cytochrome c heme attachment protein [Begonia pedatifida]P56770.1 RecName: Full=Cytochrome c biogenesis protein CcsA [Arabidopsis thaliana]USM10077.1 cytochrome c heme attachment protein [Bidens pilosa]WCO86689.1 cytochrome c heme attachment protein [Diospyros kaki var. silvestris]KAG7528875.1 Cytochrome c-type biogenesis protein CcsA [Arabidopsis suecica]QBI37818.1 cytochrome c b|eukprot:NP_051108.1 cytochrome c biogenesis protein (chloroplast) [Arabidopsis thaliana]